jgi:uncharacterized protein YcaQ
MRGRPSAGRRPPSPARAGEGAAVSLTRDEARRRLVSHLGLARDLRDTRTVLERLRCIQLDPLDVIGTNADLVVMARVESAQRGDVWKDLFPRHAFEHFAKERCILPSSAFPFYRQRGHAAQTPWWRHSERELRVPKTIVDAVLAEVREHGPITARDLTDHGSVDPIDWSGWKGTAKATTMALEMLWTRCDIVVSGRTDSGAKLYDIARRALGAIADAPVTEDFDRWAIRERARAAGLLSRSGGSIWSMLSQARTSHVPDAMVEAGELVDVAIEGSPRRYLAVPELLDARIAKPDDRVRILGPLDPLLWDRNLVRHLFGFDYVWEVYKPASQRKWGWYVCPLLYRGHLVARVDVSKPKWKLWLEDDAGSRSR